jgi:hypothetical protein
MQKAKRGETSSMKACHLRANAIGAGTHGYAAVNPAWLHRASAASLAKRLADTCQDGLIVKFSANAGETAS